MAQLEIAYFIVTFLIGFVSLGLGVFFYFNQKDEIVRNYNYFYFAFTAVMILNFVSSYMRTNISDYKGAFYYILLYLENPFFLSLMIFVLPYFFHSFLNVENNKKRNIIFILLAVVTLALHNGLMFIEKQVGSVPYLALFKNIVFVIVLIYIWYLLLTSKGLDERKTKFVEKLSIVFFLVILVIVNDIFLLDTTGIKFFPVLYAVLGLAFIRFFYKEGSGHSKIKNGRRDFDKEEFASKYNLSKREMEVINLLNEGKSYREISEELFISLNTVKTHIRNIYPKLDVSSRHEIVNLINNISTK